MGQQLRLPWPAPPVREGVGWPPGERDRRQRHNRCPCACHAPCQQVLRHCKQCAEYHRLMELTISRTTCTECGRSTWNARKAMCETCEEIHGRSR